MPTFCRVNSKKQACYSFCITDQKTKYVDTYKRLGFYRAFVFCGCLLIGRYCYVWQGRSLTARITTHSLWRATTGCPLQFCIQLCLHTGTCCVFCQTSSVRHTPATFSLLKRRRLFSARDCVPSQFVNTIRV